MSADVYPDISILFCRVTFCYTAHLEFSCMGVCTVFLLVTLISFIKSGREAFS